MVKLENALRIERRMSVYFVCGAILMTVVYNATGGSLPLMIVMHRLFNLTVP